MVVFDSSNLLAITDLILETGTDRPTEDSLVWVFAVVISVEDGFGGLGSERETTSFLIILPLGPDP